MAGAAQTSGADGPRPGRNAPGVVARLGVTLAVLAWLAWGNFGWVDHVLRSGWAAVDARVLDARATEHRWTSSRGQHRATRGVLRVAYELDGRAYEAMVHYAATPPVVRPRLRELANAGAVTVYVDPREPSAAEYREGPRDCNNALWLLVVASAMPGLYMLNFGRGLLRGDVSRATGWLGLCSMAFFFLGLPGSVLLTVVWLATDAAFGLAYSPWLRVGCAALALLAGTVMLRWGARARAPGASV